jgi:hypothetical protein
MDGLRRKPVPDGMDDELILALARVPGRASVRARRFSHDGKPYIAYEGGVPAFKAGNACCDRVRCQRCGRLPPSCGR